MQTGITIKATNSTGWPRSSRITHPQTNNNHLKKSGFETLARTSLHQLQHKTATRFVHAGYTNIHHHPAQARSAILHATWIGKRTKHSAATRYCGGHSSCCVSSVRNTTPARSQKCDACLFRVCCRMNSDNPRDGTRVCVPRSQSSYELCRHNESTRRYVGHRLCTSRAPSTFHDHKKASFMPTSQHLYQLATRVCRPRERKSRFGAGGGGVE